jgi:translation initiation factor 1
MVKKETKLVWTSDPEEARKLRESSVAPKQIDAAAASQTIRVAIDRKRRGGKSVTVATGFDLTDATLQSIARDLKKRCGTGGTAKEGEIEIQGEKVEEVKQELLKRGFKVK